MVDREKHEISADFAEQATAQEQAKRNAWRALLIPAVGSAAFFATTLANVIKTYRKEGFPSGAFTLTDKVLMATPFIIFGLAMHEIATNTDSKVTEQ